MLFTILKVANEPDESVVFWNVSLVMEDKMFFCWSMYNSMIYGFLREHSTFKIKYRMRTDLQ